MINFNDVLGNVKVFEKDLSEINGIVFITKKGNCRITINKSIDDNLKQLLVENQIKNIIISKPTSSYIF